MVGDVSSAPALLHQLTKRQRTVLPQSLREAHLHPGYRVNLVWGMTDGWRTVKATAVC